MIFNMSAVYKVKIKGLKIFSRRTPELTEPKSDKNKLFSFAVSFNPFMFQHNTEYKLCQHACIQCKSPFQVSLHTACVRTQDNFKIVAQIEFKFSQVIFLCKRHKSPKNSCIKCYNSKTESFDGQHKLNCVFSVIHISELKHNNNTKICV